MSLPLPVQVRMVGVEAAGEGVNTDKHAATLTMGTPGVLHGSFSYLLQDSEGQIIDPHSISAGYAAATYRAMISEQRRGQYKGHRYRAASGRALDCCWKTDRLLSCMTHMLATIGSRLECAEVP